MTHISLPLSKAAASYEVVVIGSGYGGGIAASRLSRAGRKVCLLERGREIQSGDFPSSLPQAVEQMQVHTAGGHSGSATGLYDFHVHEGISVLVGCGLGGTSLINANVSIEPEDRVFEDTRWPSLLREEFAKSDSSLRQGYRRAAQTLRTNPLPDHIQLHKLDALRQSAEANGEKFYRTNINVNFDIDGENEYGVQQKPCNLCGDCCSGCNHQSKNTTLVNYLPDAVAHGAEIFTEASVSHIEKDGDTWLVHYHEMNTGEQKFDAPTRFIKAGIVILSAGTLGSTEIMLRSKAKGLKASGQVGEEFSGNGDVLGFAYNTDVEIDGVGAAQKETDNERAAGPCITGVIDLRGQADLEDGMIIEDAAIPGVLASLLPEALAIDNALLGVDEELPEDHGFLNSLRHKERVLESVLRGPYHGAIRNTQTYLLMTHDGEHGKMELKNDRLAIDWTDVGKEEIFKKADKQLRKETKALSGMYIKNPVWIPEMHNELVTVHPLGGCCMGETIHTGVVNHKGQVFSGDSDTAVYENFYITDGSVVPRSLGVNPLLTISAISERCCALLAADRGWTIDFNSAKKLQALADAKATVGVEFTETMRGFISPGTATTDFKTAFDQGKENKHTCEFTLNIRSEDVYTMIKNSDHAAGITGTVTASFLSSKPMNVSKGEFNLFVADPSTPNTRLMKYRMTLDSEEGKTFFFYGYKKVHHDKTLDEWPDTSTLFISIYEGSDDTGTLVARGILHILIPDFAKQMTTMKAVNAKSSEEGLKALVAFGGYFSKSLFEIYGGIATPNEFFNPAAPPRLKRELKMSAPEYYNVLTEDNVQLLLTRYRGGEKGPLMMVHAFNGNRLNFSIDTIDTNLAEYFYSLGFDVWLLDNRLSSFMPSCKDQHTCDVIARYDYPAAIAKIIEVSGRSEVDVLAHCVGSITMFMSLLQGLQGVRSLISTQIASDFYPATQVKLKAGLHLPQVLDFLGIHSLNAFASTEEDWENKLYDKFIKLYATEVAGFCTDPVCQRMTFMFGPLYVHEHLNDATHKANVEMWGKANMTTYEQLTRMIRSKKLLNAEGEDVYMPNLKRLAIPITFIHGSENQVFDPESTLATYNTLCEENGKDLYQRYVIEGYGHNDCIYGKDAVKDVYPFMAKHFERFSN